MPITLIRRLALLALAGCTGAPVANEQGSDPTQGCTGGCAESAAGLSTAEVERILAQGIAEARARNVEATLAVVDAAGNVLGVYRMGDPARRKVALATGPGGQAAVAGGLEGIRLPVEPARVNIDDQAAIAKAITGAYLSSEGNAFSTRTAAQIVQEHFDPGEEYQPSGPLFGVQFSQLACSDVVRPLEAMASSAGPRRSPLGLSADPGGFPLYKGGAVVGGVGVMADGVYGLAHGIADHDGDLDEAIAWAASFGFIAPVDRRADRITADGRTLRFSAVSDLASTPGGAPALGTLDPAVGALVKVAGYTDGVVRAGTVLGQPASGVRPDREGMFGQDAFVLVDAADAPRFSPRAGSEAADTPLSAAEVQALLRAALGVANRSRAQIRRPNGTPARVNIAVVDARGVILGLVRTRDAPLFGADVAVQKARSAAWLSSGATGTFVQALPPAKYLSTTDQEVRVARAVALGEDLQAARDFLGGGAALADGAIAYSTRALGNMARPLFPDGIDGQGPGGFSRPMGQWSVLATGMQLDLSLNAILQHILYTAGAVAADVQPGGCTGVDLSVEPGATGVMIKAAPGAADLRLGNGLQIFPGGVPLYRRGSIAGGIGVSGDGVDQDDMIAFLAVHEAALAAVSNAAADRRADTLTPQGVRLRYVQCPQAPFLDGGEPRACAGK